MKTLIAVLALAALPLLGEAAGDHAGGHGHPSGEGPHAAPDTNRMPHGAHGPAAHTSAIGRPGDPAQVSRTFEVIMHDDMRFTPAQIRVKAGETVRFFLRNRGNLPHEFVLGTRAELAQHAAEMRAQPHMQHADPNMAEVAPGRMGGIVWQFERPGTVSFACLVPGHFEAGMVGSVEVE